MIREALQTIPSDHRETWVLMGMAVKSELGDAGFEIWDGWSQSSDNYQSKSTLQVWKSIKPYGKTTIGTLYAEAKRYGWKSNSDYQPIMVDKNALRQQQQAAERKEQWRRKKAAQEATKYIKEASFETHDYLVKKGFPDNKGLVKGSKLLIPMRDCLTQAVTGLQTIAPWGEKKFLTGSRAKGSVFCLGQGQESYLCEGYATALSVQTALKTMHQQARVIVTFSAANLAHVAQLLKGRRYIIADHDKSGTGETYARKAGVSWWMPPVIGDANDFHMSAGVFALAKALNSLRRSCDY